ncbi:hypothetical protein HKCCE3408_04995 [Rhodobacterales bacterium HKCCE3408]|nr:hypothetical protein [Rhodobacterales bacterium HKCCE3408]
MDAAAIYRDALVWDDHGGFAVLPGTPIGPFLDPWREARVDYLSICAGFDAWPPETTLQSLASLRHQIALEIPYATLVASLEEVAAARNAGRMAVTFDIEGMRVLGGRIEMVRMLYDLGVRHMNFAYNRNSAAGSGCHDEDIGLTDFGRAVIDEMNRVGMVIDCTHCGFRTTMEAMERSALPVNFTHSNPRALADHGRNIGNDQIRACAATGGVVGINGINLFLGVGTATPADVARHAAYVADLVGTEHVGLCLDDTPEFRIEGPVEFLSVTPDADAIWPASAGYGPGLSCLDIRRLPDVAAELLKIGFSDDDLRRVLGLNFARVARQVWKPAPSSLSITGP